MSAVPNEIRKEVVLKAPQRRVWKALSNADAFGAWFGVRFDGPFVAGQKITGKITPTEVDPEVAKMQKPYEGKAFEFVIDRIDPESLFSFRWHPFAIDEAVDYSAEEKTLVTFELSTVPEGTRLIITESGFDKIPAARRAQAFAANDGGWQHQAKLIEKYLAIHAS